MFSIFFLLCCAILHHSFAGFDPTKHPNWPFLQNANCEGSTNSRIIGGTPASLHEFPWMAWLLSQSTRPGAGVFKGCDGSILNKRTVLTAAHCVRDVFEEGPNDTFLTDVYGVPWKIKVLQVVLGDHHLFINPECAGCGTVQEIDVKEIISHSSWNKIYWLHDIALVRLAQDIEFNPYTYPVCLPRGYLMEDRYTNFESIAAGWGKTDPYDNNNFFSPILLKVSLRVQDHPSCHPNLQICAGGQEGGKGVCDGDSGGPLMIADELLTPGAPRYYAIGIVSRGTHNICAIEGYPQIYTRVASHMPWILDNLIDDTVDYTIP